MILLALVAFAAATLGSISGLGGGIFIMPVLLQVYSHEFAPAGLAVVSLGAGLLNSLTSLYLGKQAANVDWSFAKRVATMATVGALIGIYLQSQVSRDSFQTYLAILLLVLGVYTLWRAPLADAAIPEKPAPFGIADAGAGTMVGMTSSFFGIGGGVLMVPYMVYFCKRAVKQATATSQVVLGTSAVVSLTTYLAVVRPAVPWDAFLYMAPAVILGGILGSRFGARMRGPWIVRLLALVLLYLAYRIS